MHMRLTGKQPAIPAKCPKKPTTITALLSHNSRVSPSNLSLGYSLCGMMYFLPVSVVPPPWYNYRVQMNYRGTNDLSCGPCQVNCK